MKFVVGWYILVIFGKMYLLLVLFFGGFCMYKIVLFGEGGVGKLG